MMRTLKITDTKRGLKLIPVISKAQARKLVFDWSKSKKGEIVETGEIIDLSGSDVEAPPPINLIGKNKECWR